MSSITILSAAILFLAAFVKTTTGFGSAIIGVPLLTYFFSPRVVVSVLCLNEIVLGTILTIRLRRHIRLNLIAPLAVFGLIGIPVGVFLLLYLPENVIKILIGIIVVAASIPLAFGFSLPLKGDGLTRAGVGFLSGLLGGSTGMSGPPIILLLQKLGLEKTDFRTNIIAYFMMTYGVQFIMLYYAGTYTTQTFHIAVSAMPGMLAGFILGEIVHPFIGEEIFRKVVAFLLMAAGAFLVIRHVL